MTTPNRLSKAAVASIDAAGDRGVRPAISIISVYELLYAKRRNRVQLHVSDAVLLKRLRALFDFVPITETIVVEAASLAEAFDGDPMDRFIAATAMAENCALITCDDRIRSANVCKTIW